MKTISLVIPVYNEEKRVQKTFQALKEGFSFSGLKLSQVIFVNDGSTDRTLSLIEKEAQKLSKILKAQVQVVSYKANRGKGYAVRNGMQISDADYTLFLDTDMSTPLSQLKKFIPAIRKGVDVIFATRKNGTSLVLKHQPLYRELLGRGFTVISNLILGTNVSDFTCGFKAFSRKALREIFPLTRIDRWGYDSEIAFLANKLQLTYKELSVVWTNDEGSKVNLIYALPKTIIELIAIRLNDIKGFYAEEEFITFVPQFKKSFKALFSRENL